MRKVGSKNRNRILNATHELDSDPSVIRPDPDRQL